MKILIICTGNSCRSQMAQGWLQSHNADLEVFSAGTHPEHEVNPNAVAVMAELGIDIGHHRPVSVEVYLGQKWDYVITVCDAAQRACPPFNGKVKHRLHKNFEDPALYVGSPDQVMGKYREVRDELISAFRQIALAIEMEMEADPAAHPGCGCGGGCGC